MTPSPRSDRRAMAVALVVGTPISALLLWLALRSTDLGAVRETLATADPLDIAFGVVLMLVVYAVQAARWAAIARVRPPKLQGYAEYVVSGVACNNVLPGRLGDILRARWLAVASGLPSGRALATVVFDRGFDLLALVVFLAVSLPTVADQGGWLVRVAAGAVVLVLVLAVGLGFARLYTRRRERGRRTRGVLRRLARDALEGLAEPLGRGRIVEAGGLSIVAWALWSLGALSVARAVGIDLDVLDVVFVAAIVNLGVAVPSSPGFVGTYQWLGIESLAVIGVDRENALAFSILLHAAWFVPTTLIGGLLLVRRGAVRLGRRRVTAASRPPG